MNTKKLNNFPIKMLLYWNIFTVILFVFSPFEWEIDITNYVLVLIFLFVNLTFLYIGYRTGLKTTLKVSYQPSDNLTSKWFNFAFYIKLLWFLPSYCDKLGLDLFDFKTMLMRLALGYSNFAESYAFRFLSDPPKQAFLFFLVKQFLYTFSAIVIPLGILLWGKINLAKKIAIGFFILFDLFYWVGIGTNVGVVNNFLTILFILAAKYPSISNFRSLPYKFKFFFFVIPLLILLLFSINISQRNELSYKRAYNVYNTSVSGAKIEKEKLILQLTPTPLHSTIIFTSSYLNQGYYHTAMAFDEKFNFTYGLGNNFTMLGISPKLAGEQLLPKTYVGKLVKKGVDPEVNWHSAYLWFANDFTFFGVPIVLFIFGFLLAFFWKLTLNQNDAIAPIIFLYCVFEIFFLCGNNVIFSFSFYTFHLLILFWLINIFTHAKKRTIP